LLRTINSALFTSGEVGKVEGLRIANDKAYAIKAEALSYDAE
jgi:hypothetical protein